MVTGDLETTPPILNPLRHPTGSRTTTSPAVTQAYLPAMEMGRNVLT
jgi:hypothetical protein